MKILDVYAKYAQSITASEGCYLYNEQGEKFLDFYSGHGVISLGHQHPYFVERLKQQMDRIIYYSNVVELPIQKELAENLGNVSGYEKSQLFLVNSGAEAIENAIKIAHMITKKTTIVACRRAFHGRTSLALQVTDNSKLQLEVCRGLELRWIDLNDSEALEQAMDDSVCAVLVEAIQGVGGIHEASEQFLKDIRKQCDLHSAMMIVDEIQSGFARSGKFFAHQIAPQIEPDLITMAKGMGNGFPVGGLIISEKYQLEKSSLGTTFGGNPLACAAALAVVEVIEKEALCHRAEEIGSKLKKQLESLSFVTEVRGRGLMLAIDLPRSATPYRRHLVSNHHIFVGGASSEETLRLLPPLTIDEQFCSILVEALESTHSYLDRQEL